MTAKKVIRNVDLFQNENLKASQTLNFILRYCHDPLPNVIVDPGEGRTYAIGAPTKPEIDPGGRTLPDVDVLSHHRNLVPDRGQHSAQDQVPALIIKKNIKEF